eukprot:6214683-Pleurochrysis_carterae.AAC.3
MAVAMLSLAQHMRDELKCVICLDQLTSAVRLECEHYFCAECMACALRLTPNCPICKAEVTRRAMRADTQVRAISDAVNALFDALQQNGGVEVETSPFAGVQCGQKEEIAQQRGEKSAPRSCATAVGQNQRAPATLHETADSPSPAPSPHVRRRRA